MDTSPPEVQPPQTNSEAPPAAHSALPISDQPSAPPSQNQGQPQAPAESHTDTYGIISIVLSLLGMGLIGFIVGLIGARKAKQESRSPLLSRIGWILGLIFALLTTAVIAITFAAIPTLQRSSRDTVRKNDLSRLAGELEQYRSTNDYYPASLDDLTVIIPKVDPAGNPYTYTALPDGCTQCTDYRLQTRLENGELYEPQR